MSLQKKTTLLLTQLFVRAGSLYYTVDDPADELKIGMTRKKKRLFKKKFMIVSTNFYLRYIHSEKKGTETVPLGYYCYK